MYINMTPDDMFVMRFDGLSKANHNIEIGKTFPFKIEHEVVGNMLIVDVIGDDVKFRLDDGALEMYRKFGKHMFSTSSFSIGKK